MLPRPLEQRMTPILSSYECIKLSYLFFVFQDLNCERAENRWLGETQRFSVIQIGVVNWNSDENSDGVEAI
jgi:hypothetical protein